MSQPVESPHTLFQFERFRFTIKVASPMVLPPYKGAVFRGAFGNAFRRIVCVVPRADCTTCLLRPKCLYVSIFEPPPPADYPDAAKFSHAPPPYVLNPPLTNRQSFRPGDLLDFELVLIGPAIEALPYFIYTFVELGGKGLGRSRGRYDLTGVDLIRGEKCYPMYDGDTQTLRAFPPYIEAAIPRADAQADAVTLNFITPVRLKVKGDLVTHLTFQVLFERLVNRLTLLNAFYSGSSGPMPDLSPLLSRSRDITTAADRLRWNDWERYSSRQREAMNFGGLRGRVSFSGGLRPYIPWLRLGEQVNVGQSTTFGLGRFSVVARKVSEIF